MTGELCEESGKHGATPHERLRLTELILLDIGPQRSLITPTLFTTLAVMPIGTTPMAGQRFSLVNGGVSHPAEILEHPRVGRAELLGDHQSLR